MSKERIEELKDQIAVEQSELRALIKDHRYTTATSVAAQILRYTIELNELHKIQSQEVAQ